MTEAKLHREEWIEERAALLEFEAGYTRAEADRMAAEQWRQYAADRGLGGA
ncbi:MAG: hypothetical protein ACK53C_11125 [Pseudomonadota bacterium]|jgi:hypothetical protein